MIEIQKGLRNKCGIYTIRCNVNGMCYIGQSTNLGNRLHEHFSKLRRGVGRNKRLLSDFLQYGEDAFEISITYCDRACLNDMERDAIRNARENGTCYNVFSGGRDTYKADEEFKKRASEIHLGRNVSDAEREKHAANAKEQWHDEAFREVMVNSARQQWKDPAYRKIMRDAHLKVSDTDAEIISALYKAGATGKDLAKLYRVTPGTITNALRRISK